MDIRKMGLIHRGCFCALIASAVVFGAFADTTIAVESVVQRWPWNNKVDITYLVDGGQDVAAQPAKYRKIVFTTVIDGITYTIDGVHDVGASANTGRHTVTWTAPAGVKCANCTMSAAVYSADAPSGDDYMVIDLDSTNPETAVSFEGLLATQTDSNARYNSDDSYKTNRMVLRKIPVGTYMVGDNYSGSGAMGTKTTDHCFYAGVFPVTQYQYEKIVGSNPSGCKTQKTGNTVNLRPVENVSWYTLRRPEGNTDDFAPTTAIPQVAEANTGNFFQRLMYITGNRFSFDLPTEVMAEIAIRAGNAGTFYWSGWDDTDASHYVISNNDFGNMTGAVGLKKPNAWGLYDVCGNVYEWCLDDDSASYAKNAGTFIPAWNSSTKRRHRGGASWDAYSSSQSGNFRAGIRGSAAPSGSDSHRGFRVFWIVD